MMIDRKRLDSHELLRVVQWILSFRRVLSFRSQLTAFKTVGGEWFNSSARDRREQMRVTNGLTRTEPLVWVIRVAPFLFGYNHLALSRGRGTAMLC
jgi:hypothetical protein